MKPTLPDLDLAAIAARIGIARGVYGSDFNLGTVDFTSGELTPRSTVDVLRDQDRVALFREVRRLRLQLKDLDHARQLVQEALDSFTNPESRVDLREWVKTARLLGRTKPTTTPDDDDELHARIDTKGDPQDVRPASKGGGSA
jgi:hypothetical protein